MKNSFLPWPTKDTISHERFGRGLAGISVLISTALGYHFSPYWLLVTMAIALNLTISSLTNRCPIKSLLVRLGLPGERDIGRAEAAGEKAVCSRTERTDPPVSGCRWHIKRADKEPSEQMAMS